MKMAVMKENSVLKNENADIVAVSEMGQKNEGEKKNSRKTQKPLSLICIIGEVGLYIDVF